MGKKYELETGELTQLVYNKIARWHNGEEGEPDKQSLIILSNDVIESVLETAFKNIAESSGTHITFNPAEAEKVLKKSMAEYDKEQAGKTEKKGFFKKLFK